MNILKTITKSEIMTHANTELNMADKQLIFNCAANNCIDKNTTSFRYIKKSSLFTYLIAMSALTSILHADVPTVGNGLIKKMGSD